MLIKTRWMFKDFAACTVWPFIFIRKEKADDTALIEHEMVHYKEQRRCLVIPWLLRYWLSDKFRIDAEVRAYKRQVELGGITVGKAAYLLTKYGVPMTYLDAVQLLQNNDKADK